LSHHRRQNSDRRIDVKRQCVLVLALALSACATPYQERGVLGGFTDSQLGPRIWRVSFLGNGVRTVDEVKDMVLLRSAELVKTAGYNAFVVRQSTDQSMVSGVSVGGVSSGVWASVLQPIKYPEISAVIEARASAGAHEIEYQADFLLASLGAKYGRLTGKNSQ
jgi:hypothetical protein